MPRKVKHDFDCIADALISIGVHTAQNYLLRGDLDNLCEVTFSHDFEAEAVDDNLNASIRQYLNALRARQYTFLLKDGALVQAQYTFSHGALAKQRFAYIERPFEEEWELVDIPDTELGAETLSQAITEPAEGDVVSEDQVDPNVNIAPGAACLRIDYDPVAARDLTHATTHLTLSDHKHCRIPVTRPMQFREFVRFIFLTFRPSEFEKLEAQMLRKAAHFQEPSYSPTISTLERSNCHLFVR